METADFISHCLSGSLPYLRRHINVQNVLSTSLNKKCPSFYSLNDGGGWMVERSCEVFIYLFIIFNYYYYYYY